MDSGFYVAYAGLSARMQALDIVASNLANASTVGFKAQNAFYRSFTAAQEGENLSPFNQAVNQFGMLGGSSVDLRTGSFDATGNSTDLAIEGDGYFTIQTSAGVRYTRNGTFRLNSARQVTTQEGDLVLAEQGRTTVPITLPTGALSVSADGTMSVDGGLVAKLHVAQFAPGTSLTPEGSSKFVASPASEIPAAGASVRQGVLESSNLNPVQAAVGLILLQRQADLLGRALAVLNGDFNRAAAQDVPHV